MVKALVGIYCFSQKNLKLYSALQVATEQLEYVDKVMLDKIGFWLNQITGH